MPSRGPSIYRITDIEQAIAAATTPTTPGSSTVVKFRWPKPLYITGLFVFAKSGLDVDAAKLKFTVQDQRSWDLVTSGVSTEQQPVFATVGAGRRWYPMNILVHDVDIWQIQFFNYSANTVLTPIMYVEFEDAPQ